jgi:hypothetical protein
MAKKITLPWNGRKKQLIHKKYLSYILGAVIAALFFIVLFGIGMYRLHWQSPGVEAVSRIIPYPALLVDWEGVPISTYLSDIRTLNRYWNFQRDNSNVLLGIPLAEEIRERSIHKLIQEKIIRIYARKNNILVTQDELFLEWERLRVNTEASQEITQFLDDAYGWSDEQFIKRVLEPFLLQQKVKAALVREHGAEDEDLEGDALEIYVLAIEEGADFGALAEQYSFDADTAHNNGSLGYFSRGTMDPRLEEAIFSMSIGEISKPIQSSFGWHVLKLDDLLYGDDGVATQASASHILIRGFDFGDWVENQKRKLTIYRLVK